MTKSYNEFFNAEQKQKNELVYACGGGYAVSFSHLSTQEEIDAMYEELERRSRRERLKDVEMASSPYSKGCIQADCDIFYDVPGKGRSAVFVDDHGMGTRWIICRKILIRNHVCLVLNMMNKQVRYVPQ